MAEIVIFIAALVAFAGFMFMALVLLACIFLDEIEEKRRRCDHDYKYIAERKMWVCNKCGKETKL